jgi:hypothetical protein
MWMDVDVALAEVPVNLMPLTDDTDFKSREVAIAYNQAGMDLVWNFVTPLGSYTQTAVTPTSLGTYDWLHQGDGMYSIEIPASGGASINNDTEGFGWFTGFCTGVLPWRGPVIGFRAAGLNDLLIDNAYSTTRGLAGTALPAAAAGAAGGLLTCTSANVLPTDSIVAASIATDAITAAKIADNAIDAGAIASNAITSAKIATGAITSGTFAAGAINAAAIAADAITDAKVASDVTIASVTGAVGSVSGAVGSVTGNVGGNVVGTVASVVGAVGSVTGNVGGNVTGSVGSIASGGITTASFAAGAINAAAIAGDAITDAKVAADVTIASVTGAVGSVTGAVGSVTGAVGSVTGSVGGNVTGSVGSLAAQAKADVNAEVVDALNVDTYAEPTGTPPATASLVRKIGQHYKHLRNEITQTATTQTLKNDGGSSDITATVSDDGTTFTRAEWS